MGILGGLGFCVVHLACFINMPIRDVLVSTAVDLGQASFVGANIHITTEQASPVLNTVEINLGGASVIAQALEIDLSVASPVAQNTAIDLTISASIITSNILDLSAATQINQQHWIDLSAASQINQNTIISLNTSDAVDQQTVIVLDSAVAIDSLVDINFDSATAIDVPVQIDLSAAIAIDAAISLDLSQAQTVEGAVVICLQCYGAAGGTPQQPGDGVIGSPVRVEMDLSWTVQTSNGDWRLIPVSKYLHRVSDDANIDVSEEGFNLRTDLSSFGYSFDATIVGDTAYHLLTEQDTTECVAHVNGFDVPVLIESVEPAGAATLGNQMTWRVMGRSPSSNLALPRQRKITMKFSTATTAAQVASTVLTAANNVAGDTWVLNWAIDDWDIPADVLSVENLSPMQIIRRLADAVGAYISTDRDTRTLNVRYIYPKNPTQFIEGDQAAVIQDNFVIQRGESQINVPGYNRVIYRGVNTGCIVQSTLTGTAGDIEAPVQTQSMILTPQVGRNAGRFFLYENGYAQRGHSFTMPISAEYPMIEPGAVVKVNSAWFGITDSLSITAKLGSALQQVTVRRYT